MKVLNKLLLAVAFLSLTGVAHAQYDRRGVSDADVYYPEPTGFVVDTSDVINNDIENQINQEAEAFKGSAEIAVVTIKTTQPLDEAQYAINLATKWGVGDKQKDNGVLLLIVTEDRKVRIEVGTGLEGEITDSEAGRILDNIVVPALKAGDWSKASLEGFHAIQGEISAGEGVTTDAVAGMGVGATLLIAFLILVAVVIILAISPYTPLGGEGSWGYSGVWVPSSYSSGSSSGSGFGGFGGGGFSGGGSSRGF